MREKSENQQLSLVRGVRGWGLRRIILKTAHIEQLKFKRFTVKHREGSPRRRVIHLRQRVKRGEIIKGKTGKTKGHLGLEKEGAWIIHEKPGPSIFVMKYSLEKRGNKSEPGRRI